VVGGEEGGWLVVVAFRRALRGKGVVRDKEGGGWMSLALG
jgi:hypothetical protein